MHIKLTETLYFDSDGIEMVQLFRQNDQSCVQVALKNRDVCDLMFRGDEANEAWGNWQTHMRQVDDSRSVESKK